MSDNATPTHTHTQTCTHPPTNTHTNVHTLTGGRAGGLAGGSPCIDEYRAAHMYIHTYLRMQSRQPDPVYHFHYSARIFSSCAIVEGLDCA